MSSTDDFQFEPTESGAFDGDVLTPGGPATTGARQAGAGDNAEGVLGPGPAINVGGGSSSGSKKKQPSGKRSKLPLLLAGGGLLAVLAALAAGGIYFGPQFLAQNENGSQPNRPISTAQPASAPSTPVATPTPGPAIPGPAATGTPAPETPAVEPAAPAPGQAASPLAAEFAAIESWNDASFDTLYPLKDNFISSPLGKIYTALCNGELSFADQQRLYQWLEKQRQQPASENATFVFDMIENALSLQAAAPHSATFRHAARLGAGPQTWTGLLLLSQPFSMLSMSSLLAVDAELGFETEAPVEMTPEQQERWTKKVEFLTAPLPPAVKATHLIDLVDFCLACNANSRALEVTVAAERWLHNLDTKQLNAKTQSQILNLRSHLRTRHQQADQAVVIQQKQAELTMLVEQVQMAKTEADAARAAAEKAAATATAGGGGQVITPARLGELLGRLDARLAAIAPDKLLASVQDDPKQAYAKRWNDAGAVIKSLRDRTAAAPDAAAAWTAAESQAITDQLQGLDSTLLSLQIDFAVMAVPPGGNDAPPLVWNRDQIKKAVVELKARWEKARTGLTDKRNATGLEPIFAQLEKQLAAASLSPSQGAELVVALQDLASNVFQLETELAMTQTLARARSAAPGSPSGSAGQGASAGQLAGLEDALNKISQENDQLQRRLNDLRAELDRVARAPRPVSPAEIEQAAAEATERAMDRLAQMGYTPLAGGPSASPQRIDPKLPEQNPRLAREYAGTAYTLYYSGRSNELPQAIELFGLAVRHDASNPVYRYFLGLCLYRLGRASEAASQVRAGRDYERQSPDLHRPDSALARVQGSLRDWLESIRRGA